MTKKSLYAKVFLNEAININMHVEKVIMKTERVKPKWHIFVRKREKCEKKFLDNLEKT